MDAVLDFVAAILVDHSVEGQVEDAITVHAVVGLETLTPWHAISVVSVAIWPGIAPAPVANRWEATPPALPVEHFLNPGKRPIERTRTRSASPVWRPQRPV